LCAANKQARAAELAVGIEAFMASTYGVVVLLGRGNSTALELSSDDPASSTD